MNNFVKKLMEKTGKTEEEVIAGWVKKFEGTGAFKLFDGTYVFREGSHEKVTGVTGYAIDEGVEPSHFGEAPFHKYAVMFKEHPFEIFIGYEELDPRGHNTVTGDFTPWQTELDLGGSDEVDDA